MAKVATGITRLLVQQVSLIREVAISQILATPNNASAVSTLDSNSSEIGTFLHCHCMKSCRAVEYVTLLRAANALYIQMITALIATQPTNTIVDQLKTNAYDQANVLKKGLCCDKCKLQKHLLLSVLAITTEIDAIFAGNWSSAMAQYEVSTAEMAELAKVITNCCSCK